MTDAFDFFNNVLETFRSVSVLTQALLILVPPASGLGLYALRIWSRHSSKSESDPKGDMMFSSHRHPDGSFSTFRYENGTATRVHIPPLGNEQTRDATTLRLVKFMEEWEEAMTDTQDENR